MAFVKLGKVSDIPEGSGKMYEIKDRWVAVFKVNNELKAVDDICSHAEAYLHDGELDNYEIECNAHGARFDIRTGKVCSGPAVTPIDTFPIRIAKGSFEVDI